MLFPYNTISFIIDNKQITVIIMKDYDVIIIGAGPGGSSAATFCGRKGYKTLLLDKDKFPRDKICGDALSGKSMGIIKKLNIEEDIKKSQHGAVVGVVFSAPNGKQIHLQFTEDPESDKAGIACRREILDVILFNKAKGTKNVETMENFMVTEIIKENDKVLGVKGKDSKGKEHEFRANITVGAGGVYSLLAREMKVNHNDPNHMCTAVRAYYENVEGLNNNIELHFIDSILPGYFWIFPLDNGKANVGVGIITKELQKRKINLKDAMIDTVTNHPMFKERFANSKQLGEIKGWTLPFGSKRRTPYGNGWLLVGDAAALVDPFTGEGMGNAMYSGWIASEVIDKAYKANDFSEKTLIEHDKWIEKDLQKELNMSYNMQRLGKNKMLLNFIISKASKNAEAREMIAGTLSNPDAKGSYFNPLFYLKILFS